MNENVKEVTETKESKMAVNKYIEDFFGFITKTLDMFSVMKLRQKLKCLLEQFIIGLIIVGFFILIGAIGSTVIYGLFGRLPHSIYYTIRNILASLYILVAFGVGFAVLLHIFKLRYLDYYEIIKESSVSELEPEASTKEANSGKEEKKVFVEKKREKIIIRDPEHSHSKFLAGILKMVVFFIKVVALLGLIIFGALMIGLIATLITSFLFVKTGMVFVGALFGIASAVIIDFVILQILYHFIAEKKNHKTRIAVMLLSALVLAGLSIGMIVIGATKFNVVALSKMENEETFLLAMRDNLSIANNAEYIEADTNDVKVVVSYPKGSKVELVDEGETVYVYSNFNEDNYMELVRDFIKNINEKKITYYEHFARVKVYTSQENIEKLQQNLFLRYHGAKDREIEQLNTQNNELEERVWELQGTVDEQKRTIEELERELEEVKLVDDLIEE